MIKIQCKYGFYKFYPQDIKDLDFLSQYLGRELVKDGDYYTFKKLAELNNYTFKTWFIGLVPSTVSYSGDKEDIFNANNLTYNVTLDLIVPSITIVNKLSLGRGAFISSKYLPQCYGIDPTNFRRVNGFVGFFDYNYNMFMIERLDYESI